MQQNAGKARWRATTLPALSCLFGLTALTSLIDLFAPQSILPLLSKSFACSPALMSMAVNAATLGMIVGAAMTFALARGFSRRTGLVGSLAMLTVLTALIPLASSLAMFAALRFAQGVAMAGAFSLACAHAAECFGPSGWTPTLMGAYVCGNVFANILGRVVLGVTAVDGNVTVPFMTLAAINGIGAIGVWWVMPRGEPSAAVVTAPPRSVAQVRAGGSPLPWACAFGFLILFGFAGAGTFINFLLAGPAFGLSNQAIGRIYLVFGAALLITPWTGWLVHRVGFRRTAMAAGVAATAGTLLTLHTDLRVIVTGLGLLGLGCFVAQAVTTSWVGHIAHGQKSANSAIYLFVYYCGGFVGTCVLSPIYASVGWPACAMTVAAGFATMVGIASFGFREAPAGFQRALATQDWKKPPCLQREASSRLKHGSVGFDLNTRRPSCDTFIAIRAGNVGSAASTRHASLRVAVLARATRGCAR